VGTLEYYDPLGRKRDARVVLGHLQRWLLLDVQDKGVAVRWRETTLEEAPHGMPVQVMPQRLGSATLLAAV
jgi:hypothetical protein